MKQYQGKVVVFCMPGNSYSGRFLTSFVELIDACRSIGIRPLISQDYSSMVNFARCKVAGADVTRGKQQTPFGGKVAYDYMMWIDSDIAFNVESFFKLLEMDKDIASGWYAQPGGTTSGGFYTPVVEKMDDSFFKDHGSYQFLTTEDMAKKKNPMKVDYIGFGWVLIKKGVFEKIEYPWFAPKMLEVAGTMQDMCSEDVAFCHDVRKAGFEIWLDPTCRVGHEKTLVI
jgi:GT2 family glycosyltransferase